MIFSKSVGISYASDDSGIHKTTGTSQSFGLWKRPVGQLQNVTP
jgi:hypothetical protein